MQSLFYYFLLFQIAWLLTWSIGFFISYFFKLNNSLEKALFEELALGLIFWVLLTSIISTYGKTVMLGFVILGVFAFFYKQTSQVKKLNLKNLAFIFLESFIINAFIFIVFAFFIYNSGKIVPPHPDFVFYGKTAYYMLNFHQESKQLEYFYPKMNNPIPYHYFEMWLTSFFHWLFKSNTILTLCLVVFPLATSTAYWAFKVLFSYFQINEILGYILSFLFLFIAGIFLGFYKSISFLAYIDVFAQNNFQYPRIIFINISILWTVILFLKKQNIQAILILLSLPVISITTAPAVFTGIVLYAIFYYFFFEKNITILLKMISPAFLLAFYIGGFYVFSSFFSGESDLAKGFSQNTQAFDFQYFKTVLNIILGTGIQHIILYFPFITLLILHFKSFKVFFNFLKKNPFIILFLLIEVLGLFVWGVLHRSTDGVQAFSNFSTPLLNTLMVILMIISLAQLQGLKKKITWAIIALFLVVNIFNTFKHSPNPPPQTEEYIEKTQEILSERKNKVGVLLTNSKNYNSELIVNLDFATYANHLALSSSKFHLLPISIFDIPLDTTEARFQQNRATVINTSFYRFTTKQKQSNTFKSIEQSQIDFIKKHKIEYVIATANTQLSPLLKEKVKKEIIDKNTGERFILLK